MANKRESRRDPVDARRKVEDFGRPAGTFNNMERHYGMDSVNGTRLREDMNQILGLPKGAIQKNIDSESLLSYNRRGVNDVYALQDQTLKDDFLDRHVRNLGRYED